MKRDLDLIRKILIAVEKEGGAIGNSGLSWSALKIAGYSEQEIVFHINLLHEAGYLKLTQAGEKTLGADVMNPQVVRLTWEGFEFLDEARDDKRWERAKEIADKAGSLAFEILKPILVDLARQAVLGAFLGLHS